MNYKNFETGGFPGYCKRLAERCTAAEEMLLHMDIYAVLNSSLRTAYSEEAEAEMKRIEEKMNKHATLALDRYASVKEWAEEHPEEGMWHGTFPEMKQFGDFVSSSSDPYYR